MSLDRIDPVDSVDDLPPTEHEPSEITYSEQFYAARPRALRPRARLRGAGQPARTARTGPASRSGPTPSTSPGSQRDSMLHDANLIANQLSGTGQACGRTRTPTPIPRSAIEARRRLVHGIPASRS